MEGRDNIFDDYEGPDNPNYEGPGYVLHTVDGEDVPITWGEFLEANGELPEETLAEIRALEPGERYGDGGGAAPEWWIERR